MNRFHGLALLGVLWLALTTQPALGGVALTVDDAVLAALSASPRLSQVAALLTQAQGQLSEDRGLVENPRLSASASLAAPLTTVELVQPLSLSGVGRSARAADRADIQAAQARQVRARLVMATDVRLAWAQAVLSARQAGLEAQSLDLATQMKSAVGRRRDAGEATALDLRLATLAEAGAANAFMAARREQDHALLALVRLTGVEDPVLPADPTPAVPAAGSLSSKSERDRSDLLALSAQAQAAQARLDQARAAALPSVTLGVFAEDDGLALSAGPSLSFDLPLWSRKQGVVASQQGAQAVVLSQQIQAGHVVSTQQRLAADRVRDANRLQDISSPQVLDDAAVALGQIEAGYEGGELDLPTALLLRQQVVQGESAVLALTAELISARLDLLLATEDPVLIPARVLGSSQ